MSRFVVKAQDALLAMEVVHMNVMKIATQAEQESSFSKGKLPGRLIATTQTATDRFRPLVVLRAFSPTRSAW